MVRRLVAIGHDDEHTRDDGQKNTQCDRLEEAREPKPKIKYCPGGHRSVLLRAERQPLLPRLLARCVFPWRLMAEQGDTIAAGCPFLLLERKHIQSLSEDAH